MEATMVDKISHIRSKAHQNEGCVQRLAPLAIASPMVHHLLNLKLLLFRGRNVQNAEHLLNTCHSRSVKCVSAVESNSFREGCFVSTIVDLVPESVNHLK